MNKEQLKKWLPFLLIFFFIIMPLLKDKVFFVLALIVFAIILFRKNKSKFNANIKEKIRKEKSNFQHETIDINKLKNMKNAKTVVLTVIILFLLIWLFTASIQIVDAGETGVYSLFGRVKDSELKSGFHLVIPLAKVNRMSIRTEEYTMSIAQGEGKKFGSDAITSLTKEGLSVDLDMTVLYRLNEDQASDVYRELGNEFDEKIIRPTIRTAIRDIIAQYEAKDIYSEKREEAANKIEDKLVTDLESRGIIVENVLLRNVSLPANLANAIQEKLQAEQESEKYDFILTREEKEKQRKIIEAEGQKESQRIINESLTTNYLYYLYVNQLKDRQGTIYVPTSPSTGLPLFRNIGG